MPPAGTYCVEVLLFFTKGGKHATFQGGHGLNTGVVVIKNSPWSVALFEEIDRIKTPLWCAMQGHVDGTATRQVIS